jgi:hypothetical protein
MSSAWAFFILSVNATIMMGKMERLLDGCGKKIGG